MKKSTILIFGVLFLVGLIQMNAQSKYGNVTMDEMAMTSYSQDTTAAAVILLKKGETRFTFSANNGFQYEYTFQTKIKILKSEGLDWCDQSITYFQANSSWKEDVKGLSGTTYNLENGKIEKTKLSKDFIFEEDVDKKLKIKKFTMPAAKVGSVIEFKYTLISDDFYDIRDFSFQSSIPTLHSSYKISIPEYFQYNINTSGYIPLSSKVENTNETFIFSLRTERGLQNFRETCNSTTRYLEGNDIPALKNEPYIWALNDYKSKITFELRGIKFPYSYPSYSANTWEKIDSDLLKADSFGGNLKKTNLFKNITKKDNPSYEYAKEILDTIKQMVKWNDKNAITAKDLKDVLKEGIGNNAEVNFLLINALKAGGLNAFPVVLSTRSNGILPFTHPSISSLNYMITGVLIDSTTYFTDAAAKYGDWNILPEKCLVTQGRAIIPEGSKWIDLTKLSTGSIFKRATIEITEDNILAKVSETRKGSASYNTRVSYSNHKDQNEYIETLSKNLACQIDSFNISDINKTGEQLTMSYTQVMDGSLGDDIIYLNPMVEKLYKENPFKAEKRTFPIQFSYLTNYIQIVSIAIPEGYIVEELPKSEKLILNDNLISLTYRMNATEKLINLHYQFQLKQLQFLPSDYEHLQDFFAKIVLKNSEQIVLKKKSKTEE